MEGIIDDNNLKRNYEILCDILEKDLKVDLNIDYPKLIKDEILFEINDSDELKFICSIKQIKYEIDGTGMIREKIQLNTGKISFEKGIQLLTLSCELKNNFEYNNTFKSPIIYKNFADTEIPPNKVILCEIKSGFDIDGIKKQFVERIEAIKEFMFNKEEKPLYYIGIVNCDSNNISKLEKYSNYDFNLDDYNIMIVATIDYNFFGMDLSYEIDSGYLLFKKFDNLEKRMDNLEKKFSNLESKIDTNFQNLIAEIKALHPEHHFNKFNPPEKGKNIEERKDSK